MYRFNIETVLQLLHGKEGRGHFFCPIRGELKKKSGADAEERERKRSCRNK